jgi:hypothetical protein
MLCRDGILMRDGKISLHFKTKHNQQENRATKMHKIICFEEASSKLLPAGINIIISHPDRKY